MSRCLDRSHHHQPLLSHHMRLVKKVGNEDSMLFFLLASETLGKNVIL